MHPESTIITAPTASSLAVEWHDSAWTPAINLPAPARRRPTKPLPAALSFLHIVGRRSYSLKIMKMPSLSARRPRAGFTLIELLVVIAIIGILAAMLMTALPAVVNHGKTVKARLEAQAIATAIEQYDSAYSRFPVSAAAQNQASLNAKNNLNPDFTYGGVFIGGSVFSPNLQLTNAEVIAILMDITNTTVTAVNANHQKNPQKTIFLNAKMSGWDPSQGGAPQPGVGNDLVYRDPWGNPYVITMDLNYDDQSRDAFYSLKAVSQIKPTPGPTNPNGQTGFNGLVNPDAGGNTDNFLYHGKVMVWSAGPKGMIDPGDPATDRENKRHVLSWK